MLGSAEVQATSMAAFRFLDFLNCRQMPLASSWLVDLFQEYAEVLVVIVVLAHAFVLTVVLKALWKESPKQARMDRRFEDTAAKQA